MYGMIHKAAREMALDRLGPDAWAGVVRQCHLSSQHLITAEYADDAVTMAIIDALAERMATDRDGALEAFGRHWIDYAGASAYARLMAMAGRDIETFVENLDRMHASIRSTMPLARMPHFALIESTPEALRIFYQSERDGLQSFVRGILGALADRFGETVEIAALPRGDGTEFVMRRGGSTQRTEAA